MNFSGCQTTNEAGSKQLHLVLLGWSGCALLRRVLHEEALPRGRRALHFSSVCLPQAGTRAACSKFPATSF